MNPHEIGPNPPSQEHTPTLSDEQVVAITAFRDAIAEEFKLDRQENPNITVSLVAIDAAGTVVHIIEGYKNQDEYFIVRSGHIDTLVAGRPMEKEILGAGTGRAIRTRGSGTIITLEDESRVFMPGPANWNQPPTLNGEPLYKFDDDDRPIPLLKPAPSDASSNPIIDAYLQSLPPKPEPPRS